MQEYDGKLNFATDAWSSPNHKAFMAVSVHFEHNGEPVSMVLDVVEVAKVSIHLQIRNTGTQTVSISPIPV
jgi:hypothetical protein